MTNHDEPADEAGLRRAWNTRLRDTVVLPLVPALLKDALDQGMMTAKELAYLAAVVAKCPWYEAKPTRHLQGDGPRACARRAEGSAVQESRLGALSCRCEDPGRCRQFSPTNLISRTSCSTTSTGGRKNATSSCASTGGHPSQRSRCAGPWRNSTRCLPHFRRKRSNLNRFQSEPLAAPLTDLLSEADLDDDARAVLAPHLIRALRQAMLQSASLAPSAHISNILRHVPRDRLFALPGSVRRRGVFRASVVIERCDSASAQRVAAG